MVTFWIPGATPVSFSLEDLEYLFTKLFKEPIGKLQANRRPINDSIEHLYQHYGGTRGLKWLRPAGVPDKFHACPYSIEFDYRKRGDRRSFGTYSLSGSYNFPPELSHHRQKAIKKHAVTGEDRCLVRLKSVRTRSDRNAPHFCLERAFYNDQAGTNLFPDLPLPDEDMRACSGCKTVREWDRHQAVQGRQELPSFEKSRLSNTIGVAIAITVDEPGPDGEVRRKLLLRPRKGKGVAVYRSRAWHLPLTFALGLDSHAKEIRRGSLRELVAGYIPQQIKHELGGASVHMFLDLRPVAFCRDLGRCGKPQFFLTMHSSVEFKLLEPALKRSPEYKDKAILFDPMNMNDLPSRAKGWRITPELDAYLTLLMT